MPVPDSCYRGPATSPVPAYGRSNRVIGGYACGKSPPRANPGLVLSRLCPHVPSGTADSCYRHPGTRVIGDQKPDSFVWNQ
jgi:hypothetical protein